METFFVSDLKLDSSDIAEKETALYGKFSSLIQQKHRGARMAMLIIGLAATCDTASMWLYLMANKKVWAIPVIQHTEPWSIPLLGTLCAGLRYLAEHAIKYRVPASQEPFI